MSESQSLPVILLVSGSAHTGNSMNRLLSDQFSIIQAEDAEKAWEALQDDATISVLICELELCINHYALLERIRQAQNSSIACLPVLLLVGESDEEGRRDQAFSAGASDFINMPFSSTELKARVHLHSKLFNLPSNDKVLQVSEQSSSIDLLNTLMQEQYFQTRLEQEVSFSIRHKSYVSVCLISIDETDEIKQKFGSKVLTGIIRTLARMIEKQIRSEDTYAYLGNSTFALLYPVTNGLGANIATRRLLEEVETSELKFDQQDIPVTLSAGLYSAMPLEEHSATEIMETIHLRLRKATQKGGNQIVSSKTEQEQAKVSVAQALNLISLNRTEGLDKQIPHLLDVLLPLLEFAHEHNETELSGVLDILGDTS